MTDPLTNLIPGLVKNHLMVQRMVQSSQWNNTSRYWAYFNTLNDYDLLPAASRSHRFSSFLFVQLIEVSRWELADIFTLSAI